MAPGKLFAAQCGGAYELPSGAYAGILATCFMSFRILKPRHDCALSRLIFPSFILGALIQLFCALVTLVHKPLWEFVMSRGIATILSDLFNQIAVSVFIISGSGALLFANRSGNAMIEEGWPIRLVNGALTGVDTSGSEALKKALDKRLADGAGDQAICLAIAGQGRPSAVGYLRAIPSGDTAASMLLVTQTGRTTAYGLEGLASAYKLSKAETRILKHLVEGKHPVRAAA
ncbi:hypothetical protein [Rhodomicrobium vannielii]|uniref:hypothetical protein n=1 Tax=Rhodomicrobium vannielii TaxID=1069 RepID=UPI0012DCD28E|nr:hypothetical protein [Rhodomicrobium vannielii]